MDLINSGTAKAVTDLTGTDLQLDGYRVDGDSDSISPLFWDHRQRSVYVFLHLYVIEVFITCLLIFSIILVVLETDAGANYGGVVPDWVRTANNILLSIYSIELAARIYVHRKRFFYNGWHILDISIVVSDAIMQFLEIFYGSIPSLSALRLVRLLRLARGLRALSAFPQLALMIKGLGAAMSVIGWGCLLVFVTILAWSVLAVHLIQPIVEVVSEKDKFEECERCPRAFATVSQSALTFLQVVVAGDGWGTVAVPIIEEYPASVLFFVAVIVTLNVAILNVILAVIVDSSLKASQDDKRALLAEHRKTFNENCAKLQEMFKKMDADRDSSLSLQELKTAYAENVEFRDLLSTMDVSEEDLTVVYSIIDTDNSGDVAQNEFIDELHKMKSSNSHTLLVFIKFYVTEIRKKICNQVDSLRNDVLKEERRETEQLRMMEEEIKLQMLQTGAAQEAHLSEHQQMDMAGAVPVITQSELHGSAPRRATPPVASPEESTSVNSVVQIPFEKQILLELEAVVPELLKATEKVERPAKDDLGLLIKRLDLLASRLTVTGEGSFDAASIPQPPPPPITRRPVLPAPLRSSDSGTRSKTKL